MNKKQDFEDLLLEAIENVRSDRGISNKLIAELMTIIVKEKSRDSHFSLGNTISKYLETNQKSNEQLVKILGILGKDRPAEKKKEPETLNNSDILNIFEKLEKTSGE